MKSAIIKYYDLEFIRFLKRELIQKDLKSFRVTGRHFKQIVIAIDGRKGSEQI